jgi:hypothetical protein
LEEEVSVKYDCHACKKQVTATKNNRYRSHTDGDGNPCEQASMPIPEHVLAQPVGKDDAPDVPREGIDFALCPQCRRNVKLTRMGYFEPHNETLNGGDRCATSGVRAKHARATEDVPLPGDEPKPPSAAVPKVKDSATPVANRGLAITSGAPTSASAGADSSPPEPPQSSGTGGRPPHELNLERQPMAPSPESTSTPTPSEQSTEDSTSSSPASGGPWPMKAGFDPRFLQPFSPFSQPGEIPDRVTIKTAMTGRGKEIADRLREIFYAYTNRNSSDNRSAQKTLGPSEIGTPCDRQIAMKLLGIKPTNPQEGWAPFVGTAVHKDLADMFEWANGSGSGRFVTELPLTFGSALVPRGTGDLLDRVLFMFLDHKLMGKYSLKKLIEEGPSETYRIQVQTYGLGAEMAGERIKEVAIVGWPREESTLNNLYVHVEPYDRAVAQDAIRRVEGIARQVGDALAVQEPPMGVARNMPVGSDCKWCPFHLKSDTNMERGCPGK